MGRKLPILVVPCAVFFLLGCSTQSNAQAGELPASTTPFGKSLFPLIGTSEANLNSQLAAKKLKNEGGFQVDGDAGSTMGPFGETKDIEWDIWTLSVEDKKNGAKFYSYIYFEFGEQKTFNLLGLKVSDWKKSDWIQDVGNGKTEKLGHLYSWKQFRIGIHIREDKMFTTLEVWREPAK